MARGPLHVAGPTASGKSAVALALCEALGGELLSVDSMQVYRGLDLGTAKPTPAERARVPHHLIDLADPSESFDAARWLAAAREAEFAVRARGRVPVFCGGTGLYFRAWFHGLDAPPPPDPAERARIEATPLPDLLAELTRAGFPGVGGSFDARNPRRVFRAVERLRQGAPLPGTGAPPGPAPGSDPGTVFVLVREPADLRRRIDARVDGMFEAGLVEETRRLLDRGLEHNRTAMQAIGYRQVVEHLRGGADLASTVAQVKTRTWQFARRQGTWFRHQLEAVRLEVPAGEAPEATAGRILAGMRRD